MKRSKRLVAWDAAWVEIGFISGISKLEPTEMEAAMQEALQRLYDARLPAGAIADVARAIKLAWRIGRKSASCT
jgi:hypothetical protein